MVDILVTGKKISDMDLVTEVKGDEKIPTDAVGDLAISPDQLVEYVRNSSNTSWGKIVGDIDDQPDLKNKFYGVNQTISTHVNNTANPHDVNKNQIGLGNVDNTSDVNKPVSSATQEALDIKADKSYVDTGLSLKADRSYVDSGLSLKVDQVDFEDFYQHEKSGKIFEYDQDFSNLNGGYPLNARILLNNGDIVRNSIPNNTNNPNSDMTGWVKADSIAVESVAEMLALEPHEGMVVRTLGYHSATNFALLKPYKGGHTYIYESSLSGQNDGGLVINGWVCQDVVELEPYMFGAKGGFIKGSVEVDDTLAFQNAIKSAVANKYYKLNMPSDYFLITDELLLNGIPYILNQEVIIELARDRWENVIVGCELVGEGSLSSNIIFKPATKESVCIAVRGGWGTQSRRHIRGLSILPYERSGNALTDTTDADGIAIELQGCGFTQVSDVYIGRFHAGLRLLNTAFFDFTEFNRFSNLNIYGCDKCIWFYTNSATATDSFHGNSFYSTKVQPNQNGGIGLAVTSTADNDARPYNCHFDINFFGGSNKTTSGEQVYFIYLDRGVVISASGNMTSEGVGKFYCADDFSYFESSGSYFSYDDLSDWEWNLISNWRQDQPFAFRWENISSPALGDISDPILGSSRIEQLDLLSRNGVHPSIYSSNRPENGFLGTGLVFEHIGGFGKGWTFAVKEPNSTAKKLYSRWNFSVAGNKFTALGGYLETAVNNTTLTLLSESTFGPTSNATLDSARASNVWKNIYSQNAVTVVSDARHKTEISELTEQELQCAIACSKLYRKYKLNAAVDEKGVNAARYHVGVIAQEIVQCFIDHGLDWRKYGVITYEKWDAIEAVEYQAATYDENGQELTSEVQAIDGREAGEIYMVRYDELNCFINAGLEYRLSKLEEFNLN